MDEDKTLYVVARKNENELYNLVFCGEGNAVFVDASIRQFGVNAETAGKTVRMLREKGYDAQIFEFDYLKRNVLNLDDLVCSREDCCGANCKD